MYHVPLTGQYTLALGTVGTPLTDRGLVSMNRKRGETVRTGTVACAAGGFLGVGLQPGQVALDSLQRVSRTLGRHRKVIRIADSLSK